MGSSQPVDDSYWRRPADPTAGPGLSGGSSAGSAPGDGALRGDQPAQPPAYLGPPRAGPPPAGWRPPMVVRPAEPRALPNQSPAELDLREQSANTVTRGIGMVAGAIMIVMLLILCGRWLF